MRRLTVAGVFTAAVAVGALLFMTEPRTGAAQPAPDNRQQVVLPSMGRDMVLSEMRGMLAAVGDILRAVGANDSAAAAKAARVWGMAHAADEKPELKRRLPPPFLQLGMKTHTAFDKIADALDAGAPRDQVLGAMADLTANCVACHAAYRIESAR